MTNLHSLVGSHGRHANQDDRPSRLRRVALFVAAPVVAALAVVFLFVGQASAQSVSSLNITAASSIAGASTTYTVQFQNCSSSSCALNGSDSVTVTFDAAYNVVSPGVTLGSGFTNCVVQSAVVSGASQNVVTISLDNRTGQTCAVAKSATGSFTISGVTNPTLAGTYSDLGFATSKATTAVTDSVTISAAAASQVVITPTPSSMSVSTTTNIALGLQLQDQYGNNATSSGSTSLVLSSSSSKGVFATTNGSSGLAQLTVTIGSGVGTATEYYGDQTAGAPTLTAKKSGTSWGTTSVTINPATPTVTATAPSTDTAGSAIATTSISSALAAGFSPTGTITFEAFGPQTTAPTSCSSGAAWTGTQSVSGNTTYHPTTGFTPTVAGNYWWYASYGGDGDNNTASSACGSTMGKTTVSASGVAQLIFTNSAASGAASASASVGPITVQEQDQYGNLTTTAEAVTLTSNTSGTYLFNTTSGATSPTGSTTVNIPSGSSSVSFYYGDTKAGSPTITAAKTGLTSATQGETITASGPAKLIFTNSAASGAASASASVGPITVQEQDQYGNLTTTAEAVTLTSNTSGTYLFNTTSGATSPTGSTTVNIPSGSSSVSFYYGDTKAGSPTITAAKTGLTSATQGETITASGPAKLIFTNSAASGAASASASVGPITVQEQDQYGNLTTTAEAVTLTSNTSGTYLFNTTSGATSPTGSTTVNIPSGSSSVSFYYGDTKAGSPTITAAKTGLTSATQGETITAATFNDALVFVAQPADTFAGTAISPSLTVQVEDSFGNPVSDNGLAVTLSPSVNAIASGATANTNSAGLATFSATTINTAAANLTLTASASGVSTSSPSSSFNVTVLMNNGSVLTDTSSDAGSGVASVAYYYCTGYSGNCTSSTWHSIGAPATSSPYSVTWTGEPSDGAYQVVAVGTDHVSNVSGPSSSIPVTIDNTSPTVSITFPVNSNTYTSSTWTSGGTSPCGATGMICGQAADALSSISGPSSITLTISQGSLTWNGSAFVSGTHTVLPTSYSATTGLWTYTFPSSNLVGGSSYSVAVTATDALGNTSSSIISSFIYSAPPTTVQETAAGSYTLTVPAHVTTFSFTMHGAGGGGGAAGSSGFSAGGTGGAASGTITIPDSSSATSFTVVVGGGGGGGTSGSPGVGGAAGSSGTGCAAGGAGGAGYDSAAGGGGGGTCIYLQGAPANTIVEVGAGGGGGGYGNPSGANGGAGSGGTPTATVCGTSTGGAGTNYGSGSSPATGGGGGRAMNSGSSPCGTTTFTGGSAGIGAGGQPNGALGGTNGGAAGNGGSGNNSNTYSAGGGGGGGGYSSGGGGGAGPNGSGAAGGGGGAAYTGGFGSDVVSGLSDNSGSGGGSAGGATGTTSGSKGTDGSVSFTGVGLTLS